MRVGFMGKGGSGKTTIAASFAKYFMNKGRFVLALDGDINTHMAYTLNAPLDPIINKSEELVSYLEKDRGFPIIGTTPPSLKSGFIRVKKNDPFFENFGVELDNGRLITVGTYGQSDIGSNCYHGKLSFLELILHRLIDLEDDIVVSDSTAGLDTLGTSLFASYDINIFIVEPTIRSVNVFNDFKKSSSNFSSKIYALVNKLINDSDLDFIRKHINSEDIIAHIPQSDLVRELERGNFESLSKFADLNASVFEKIYQEAIKNGRDWDDYYQKLLLLYTKNCEKWYSSYYGKDLTKAIDPNFSYKKII